MAELAALSLVCNVIQVISFAHEVYNTYEKIRETGTSDASALVGTILSPDFTWRGYALSTRNPHCQMNKELQHQLLSCHFELLLTSKLPFRKMLRS
jgi:hypothetical protein